MSTVIPDELPLPSRQSRELRQLSVFAVPDPVRPKRQSVTVDREAEIARIYQEDDKKNYERQKKKRKAAEQDSNLMKSLINSYSKEIEDLKKQVDELKKQNSEYKKYTYDMVKNPVTNNIFYKSCFNFYAI